MSLLPTAELDVLWLINHRLSESIDSGVFDKIKSKMFYTPEYRKVFEQVQKLMSGEAESVDMSYIDILFECGITTTYANTWIPTHRGYIDKLKTGLYTEWKNRLVGGKLNEAYHKLKDGNYKKPLAEINEIEDLFSQRETSMGDVEEELCAEHITGKTKGFTTGILQLDKYTEQFKRGHLWVVGGYTGRGKTTLSLQMVLSAMKAGASVDFISLEMTPKQLLDRITWLYGKPIGLGFKDSLAEIKKFRFKITDRVKSIMEIESHINSKAKVTDIFVVDFLQNIMGEGKEYDRISRCILSLQQLALKNNLCILVLSQISNEGMREEGEIMAFKGSGTIAACADVAIEIIRKSKRGEELPELQDCRIEIRKNRHGADGHVKCNFDTKNGYFIFPT